MRVRRVPVRDLGPGKLALRRGDARPLEGLLRGPPAARARRALVACLTAGSLATSLSGCRPLYVPPVPKSIEVPAIAQLGDASSLRLEGGTLTLHLVLAVIPKAGWLAVQWFAPDGTQAASDSVWVTPADEAQGRTLTLPAGVTLRAGEWRAVISLHDAVLRQFRADVPAANAGG